MCSAMRIGLYMKKCHYELVIVSTALYGGEAWGTRSAERSVNVLEMKCLRSLASVSRTDRVRMKRCVKELE